MDSYSWHLKLFTNIFSVSISRKKKTIQVSRIRLTQALRTWYLSTGTHGHKERYEIHYGGKWVIVILTRMGIVSHGVSGKMLLSTDTLHFTSVIKFMFRFLRQCCDFFLIRTQKYPSMHSPVFTFSHSVLSYLVTVKIILSQTSNVFVYTS